MAILLHKSKFTSATLRLGHILLQEIKIASGKIILKLRSVWQTFKDSEIKTNLQEWNFILLTYYQSQSDDGV